jgi:hypothetical protein
MPESLLPGPPEALVNDPELAQALDDLDTVMIQVAALMRTARELIEGIEAHRRETLLERSTFAATQFAGYGLAIYALVFDQLQNVALLVAGVSLILFEHVVKGKPPWSRS